MPYEIVEAKFDGAEKTAIFDDGFHEFGTVEPGILGLVVIGTVLVAPYLHFVELFLIDV